jgi:DNA-binding transcriptional ArsR family regulator
MQKETALFFKQYHSILKLKLSDKRKMILCALMSTYERFFDGELEYKGIRYHFYFNQNELYNALGMAQRTFEYNLKWLKENGYIKFETANKQGYLFRTTYFYINSDIISLVIPQESKDNENAEQQVLISIEDIEEENNNPTDREIAVSMATNSIPMEEAERETNNIPTEAIEVITEPTEEDGNKVIILLLKYIKGILQHASFLPKSTMNEAKGHLIKAFGIDTVRKAMYKCLGDGWFRVVDDNFMDTDCQSVKDYDMVYRKITFDDLDELDYNELYNKAKG